MGFTLPTEPLPIQLEIDGKGYDLAFDFEAVARAEDLTDQAILTGLTRKSVDAPRINFVRSMLFACLLKHQPKTTYAEAKALVTKDNLTVVWNAVIEAYISSCITEPDEDEDKIVADPKPDQS
jgi:hypothetical protein